MASNQCEQEHKQECVKDEKAIEVYNEYFRITEKSSDKQCAICQEIVWEKVDENGQLFDIINNFSHVFCFECISKQRKEDNALEVKENRKDCPVCKVKSDFIIASHF